MAIKITGPIGQGGAGGAVSSVNGATGAVNLYADNATLNLAGDGIVVNGAGATSTLDVDSGTTANKIVKLDGSARLPAVDGSQLTNLPSAPVTSVNGATGVVNLYADDATLNLAGDGIVVSGTGATSTLDVDSGTTAGKIVKLDGSARLPAVDGSQLTNLPSAPVTSVNGQTGAVTGLLEAANNLSDVANAGTARTNLGLGTAAVENVGTGANNIVQLDASSRLPAVDGSQLTNLPSAPVTSVNGQTGAVTGLLEAANNLSDVANAGTARTNLGLGTAAVENVGTGANNVVQLDASSRLPAVDGSQLTNLPSAPVTSVNGQTGAVTGLLEAANNLSDVANAATARSNLGAIADIVEDTSPQLGGPLDTNGQAIVSVSAGNIAITPDTTGSIVLDGLNWPQADGSADQVLKTNGAGQLSFTTVSGGSRPTVTTDTSGTNSTISDPSASTIEDVYLVSNGSSAVTITLPTVTGNSGYKVQVKRLGTANVTVSPASGTIDGAASKIINAQYGALTCCTDGTNWFII